jgi:hypothetical protein
MVLLNCRPGWPPGVNPLPIAQRSWVPTASCSGGRAPAAAGTLAAVLVADLLLVLAAPAQSCLAHRIAAHAPARHHAHSHATARPRASAPPARASASPNTTPIDFHFFMIISFKNQNAPQINRPSAPAAPRTAHRPTEATARRAGLRSRHRRAFRHRGPRRPVQMPNRRRWRYPGQAVPARRGRNTPAPKPPSESRDSRAAPAPPRRCHRGAARNEHATQDQPACRPRHSKLPVR